MRRHSLVPLSIPTKMAPSFRERSAISEDTLNRTDTILSEVPEGSSESRFIAEQLPPLDASKCPNYPPTKVVVDNADSFTTARNIIKRSPQATRKTAVLNLASDELQAGGWLYSLAKTQVCHRKISGSIRSLITGRSSVLLIHTLCYTQGRVLPLAESRSRIRCGDLLARSGHLQGRPRSQLCGPVPTGETSCLSPDRRRAERTPPHARSYCLQIPPGLGRYERQDSPRVSNGRSQRKHPYCSWYGTVVPLLGRRSHCLVSGAMGCGAYYCPPRQVAEEMRNILLEPEFKGWFQEIVFAVYATPGNPNFEVFSEVFEDVEV